MTLPIDANTRQRNVRLASDIEKGNGGDSSHENQQALNMQSPGTESQKRKRDRLADHLRIEEGKVELIRFWDQFMRKGKKKIGVAESFRAFFFSSCKLLPHSNP